MAVKDDDPRPGVADAHPMEQADIAVEEQAARWRDHPVVKAAGKVSELADQPPLFAICGAVLAAGVITRRPQLIEAGGRMLLAMALVTAAKSVIKKSVSRTRPNVLQDEGRYASMPGGPDEGPWSSFPSEHTAGATATSRALVRVYPGAQPWAWAASAFAGLVQLPRGAHYPLDVAAGAALGLAAEWLVDQAFRRGRPYVAEAAAAFSRTSRPGRRGGPRGRRGPAPGCPRTAPRQSG